MYAEDELLPLSGLQHLVFCERQAALIHLEQVWIDNALTVEGEHLHSTVDAAGRESRGQLRIARGVRLRSLRLGIAGTADVVEFHRLATESFGCDAVVELPSAPGRWRPFPVEYKRGRPKLHRADEVQLCAQALCLEEMLGITISEGALFYGQPRRRTSVSFDDDLRALTEAAAARFHRLMREQVTPPAQWGPKCEQCSLLPVCQPRMPTKTASDYVRALFSP
jgi:CRISPR-associated exonuclease Cas4